MRQRHPQGIPLAVQWGVSDRVAEEERAGTRSQEAFGSLTFDEHGFRVGTGLPYTKTVLFLGDSFTEGMGVGDDDTFARATEMELRRAGVAVRSFNAGSRGFGPAQELKVLRRLLDRVAVDALVLQSFPMNDLSDNLAYGGFAYEGGQLIEHATPIAPLRARLVLALNEAPWLRLHTIVTIANAVAARSGPAPYDSPTALPLEKALLAEIVRLAKQHELILVALLVPTAAVQQAPLRPQPLPRFEALEVARFQGVAAAFDELGVPVVNAGDIITDLAADARESDGSHFSKVGNARIGAAIAEQLRPRLLAQSSAQNNR